MSKDELKRFLYKLEFPRGLHIGKNKLSDSEMVINADTIFSAFCHEAKNTREGIDYLKNLTQEGFRISDVFPFYKEELFLPKPIISMRKIDQDSSHKKLYKKINYINLSNWEKYMNCESDPNQLVEWIDRLDKKEVFTKIQYEENGEHNIYNLGVRYFPKEAGLYFILQCHEKDFDFLDELIYNLSFSGIGGKRNVGVGFFELINPGAELPEKLEKMFKSNAQYYMNLSVALPDKEELKETIEKSVGYKLERRSGFIFSTKANGKISRQVRKKDLYMFQSGSVFKKPFNGNIYDVGESFEHPVYRYGMPLFIGVK